MSAPRWRAERRHDSLTPEPTSATTDHLFLAIRSQLPDEGELLAAVDRDTLKLVFDDSVEVWIDPTPGTEPGQTFQLLANSLGRRAYKHHGRGNVKELPTWKGNWEVASGSHDGCWHVEVGVPLADIAPGRKASDGAWGINVCRNWKQPWGFSSLGGGAYAPSDRFFFGVADAPIAAHEHTTNPTTGKVSSVLRIRNSFYSNRMRIRADISGLPKDAEVEKLTASIRKKGTSRSVKSVVFDNFEDSKQELAFDLPPLEGEYEIALTATGKNVPAGELVKEFQRTVYEWERNDFGKSRKVYPPFAPLEVDGTQVNTVLRKHTMGKAGLWDQVVAKGKALLAAPMVCRCQIAGATTSVEPGELSVNRIDEQAATANSGFRAGPLSVRASCAWDYDGTMRCDLTLLPTDGKQVDALTLDIPLRRDQATHYHAMGDGIRNTLYERVPDGEGVVWTAEKVQANDLPERSCSYLYVGTPVRGLCWFAENERGWSWDPATPNLELVRTDDTVTIRVHLLNKPLAIDKERTLTFGLLAAPVKPKLGDWRYKWHRGNYTLLGTDINWLARGNCGSVYPAGKDVFFWDMIKRGNREKLPPEAIQRVIDYGMPLFEPYGEDYVERYVRHVRHNLQGRFGKKMVFYYNRASCQLFDEFQTFQDEWCLTDFRTVGKGNGVGEIKIVPSESYLDYALYWYGKSFEHGGNQGVYWDNGYLRGSYNTFMTDAFVREDGSIAPASGLWGLRELSKRTFQYLNELGMLPLTMPHMTSTNILPMHSFATVQYDWEWKYSQGDVQYRFPRDYILLVSNGDLAGTWPVLLGDHGELARDPWTQRTFAACCLVHELDGGGMPEVWQPLWDPLWKLLNSPQLEVYRYWDERPQPVKADNPDLPTIVYSVPGEEAVVVVTSYAEETVQADLTIDAKALGLGGAFTVTDAETGEAVASANGRVSFPLKKHDLRQLKITP